MRIVLDASSALAFVFPDGRDRAAIRIVGRLRTDRAVVPALWLSEMQNAVITVERRGRLTAPQATALLSDIAALPVSYESGEGAHVEFARRFSLSIYDALYLDLAFSRHAPIGTRDAGLAKAAKQLGIETL